MFRLRRDTLPMSVHRRPRVFRVHSTRRFGFHQERVSVLDANGFPVGQDLGSFDSCGLLGIPHDSRLVISPRSFFRSAASKSSDASSMNASRAARPCIDEFGQFVGVRQGKVDRLDSIVLQIIELPRFALGRDGFPTAAAECTVTVVVPPQRSLVRVGGTIDLVEETLARCFRGRSGVRRAGQLQQRRCDVDDVLRVASELAPVFDSVRPGQNEWSRDAALMRPSLVASKRRVTGRRPSRSQTQVRERRTGWFLGVVTIPADHDFALAPLSDKNITRVSSQRSIARIWSRTRPMAMSMRWTIAAWIDIFLA